MVLLELDKRSAFVFRLMGRQTVKKIRVTMKVLRRRPPSKNQDNDSFLNQVRRAIINSTWSRSVTLLEQANMFSSRHVNGNEQPPKIFLSAVSDERHIKVPAMNALSHESPVTKNRSDSSLYEGASGGDRRQKNRSDSSLDQNHNDYGSSPSDEQTIKIFLVRPQSSSLALSLRGDHYYWHLHVESLSL